MSFSVNDHDADTRNRYHHHHQFLKLTKKSQKAFDASVFYFGAFLIYADVADAGATGIETVDDAPGATVESLLGI